MIDGSSTIARDITARKRPNSGIAAASEFSSLPRDDARRTLRLKAHELNQPLGAILRNTEAAFFCKTHHGSRRIARHRGGHPHDDQRAGAVIDRMRSLLKRRKLNNLLDLNVLVSEVVGLATGRRLTQSAVGV